MAKDLNIFGKIARFFRQLKAELKKVNWPARNELSKNTVIVVVTIIALTVFIWLVDLLSWNTIISINYVIRRWRFYWCRILHYDR